MSAAFWFVMFVWVASLAAYQAIDRFGNLRAFLRVLLTPFQGDQGEWRKVHVWAHVVGGAVLAVITRYAPFINPTWQADVLHRLLLVAAFQFAWEYIQIENWRFADHPQPSSYPWWSAFWDLWLVLQAACLVEIIL